MNSDRHIIIPISTILTGITQKWNDAYYFLKYSISSSTTIIGSSFSELNNNQFILNLSYYLEFEDLLFILMQDSDGYIVFSDGTNTITLNKQNILDILKFKFIRGINTIFSTLDSVSQNGDFISYNFNLKSDNLEERTERAINELKPILINYVDKYLIDISYTLNHPVLSLVFNINWDTIKGRFSNRMSLNLEHSMYLSFKSNTILVGEKNYVDVYIDGIISYDFTISSSNQTILTVDSGGLLNPISVGTSTITVQDSLGLGLTKVIDFTIVNNDIKLSSERIYLIVGRSKQLKVYNNGIRIFNGVFNINDNSLISINNGIITANNITGTTKVTVSINNISKNFIVFVSNENLSVLEKNIQMEFNDEIPLKLFLNGKLTNNFSFTIQNTSICNIINNKIITSSQRGSTTINLVELSSGLSTTLNITNNPQSIKVIIPGSLSTLIGSSKYTISNLVLSGMLNANDIILIRDMVLNGVLTSLDIERIKFYPSSVEFSSGNTVSSTTDLPNRIFKNLTKLVSIILPSVTTKLGESSLEGCSSLTSIVIPDNVTSLGHYCFYGCSSLTSLLIPGKVKSLGQYLIQNSKISVISFSPDVETTLYTDYRAFGYCSYLTNLSMPPRWSNSSNGLFDYSDNLKTLISNAIVPPTLIGSLGGSLATIKVPSQSVNAYKTAPNWSSYSSKIISI